jgi:DNA polymerase elongation subunit (family B)
MTKYIAFDIETTAIVENNVKDANITVAVTQSSDGEVLCWMTWLDKDAVPGTLDYVCSENELRTHTQKYDEDSNHGASKVAASFLCDKGVVALFEYLYNKTIDGYAISTWNGASFDFQVLACMLGRAQRPDLVKRCVELARGQLHVDIMFAFFANKGFCVSLAKVAQAMLKSDNSKSMDGKDAPIEFEANGAGQLKVAAYCVNDVRLQAAIHDEVLRRGVVAWITRKDKKSEWPAEREMKFENKLMLLGNKKRKRNEEGYCGSFLDFLSMQKSLLRPLPDVEWMKKYEDMVPWERDRFTKWMTEIIA